MMLYKSRASCTLEIHSITNVLI